MPFYVWGSGSNTAPYDTWAKAATAFGTAVAAATTAGDVILVSHTFQEAISTDAVWTFAADNVQVISVNKDSSDAPTAMGTGGWIGSNGAFTVSLAAVDRKPFLWGITIRLGGTSADYINFQGDGGHFELENCYLWMGTTNGTSAVRVLTADAPTFARFKNCTFRAGAVTHTMLSVGGRVVVDGGSISADGDALGILFAPSNANDTASPDCIVEGLDASNAATNATIVGNTINVPLTVRMSRCKLPTGSFTYVATQTNPTRASAELFMYDCAAGDTHINFAYVNALGSCISNDGVKVTAGAAGQSWAVNTSANCSFGAPFVTPWVDLYHSGTSAITPYLDLIRDGSTTAYKADEVWGEFSVKTSTGFVLGTLYSDRATIAEELAGTASNQATSALATGDWTGDTGAWFGKVDSGASVTPAEVGHIRARLCVAVNTSTTPIYLDPQIKT